MSNIRLIIVVLAQFVVLGWAEMCCEERFCVCKDNYKNLTSLMTDIDDTMFNGNLYVDDDTTLSICEETYSTLYPTQGLNRNNDTKNIVQLRNFIQQPINFVKCSVNENVMRNLPNVFKFSCETRNVALKMLTYNANLNNLSSDWFLAPFACSVRIERID